MANPTVEQVWADKDFQNLPPEEKHKVLMEIDPDFKALPQAEQMKVVGGNIPQTEAPAQAPEAQPGFMGQMANVAKDAVRMALPSQDYNKPIEGQTSGGLAQTPMAAFQAAIQTLRDPSRLQATAAQPGAIAGEAVTQKTGSKALGLVTSMALDPTTYVGGGSGATVAKDVTEEAVAKSAPTVMRVLAGVPEEATNVLLKTKDLFKKATGTDAAIEGAVKNVQDALKSTLKREGQELGQVEEKLGINKTAQEKIYEMVQGRDTGGYISKLGQMKPEELLSEYVGLKATSKMLPPTERLSQLVELKRALNDRIKSFGEIGSSQQGLLKTAAKDIDRLVKETPGGEAMRSVQAKYARARTLYNSLQSLIKPAPGTSTPDVGKAEQVLQNIFKSSAPQYKTIRRGLADLEKLSGQPVLTKLFQEFAAQALNKSVGKGGRASLGAGVALSGMGTLPFNPVAGLAQVAAGSGIMASQSPKAMALIAQRAAKSAQVPAGVASGLVTGGISQANTKVDVNRIRQYLLNSARRPGAQQ